MVQPKMASDSVLLYCILAVINHRFWSGCETLVEIENQQRWFFVAKNISSGSSGGGDEHCLANPIVTENSEKAME